MTLHVSTFQYLKSTDDQVVQMADVRHAFRTFVEFLEVNVPPGPDLDYALRQLRDAAMWCNIAITRYEDGSPRP